MGDQSARTQLIDSTLQSISVSGAEVWQDHVTYNMLIITLLVKYSPEHNVNNQYAPSRSPTQKLHTHTRIRTLKRSKDENFIDIEPVSGHIHNSGLWEQFGRQVLAISVLKRLKFAVFDEQIYEHGVRFVYINCNICGIFGRKSSNFLFCRIIPSWQGVFQHVVVDESANVPFYWGVELHISNSCVLNCVIYDRSATLQKACTCSPDI